MNSLWDFLIIVVGATEWINGWFPKDIWKLILSWKKWAKDKNAHICLKHRHYFATGSKSLQYEIILSFCISNSKSKIIQHDVMTKKLLASYQLGPINMLNGGGGLCQSLSDPKKLNPPVINCIKTLPIFHSKCFKK